ncbi:MAG: heavy metal-associated domain-containing protein [Phycisphaerales bacterium]|jgi:copper chaperone CopZ|nr:heavy metal-associated domain-containing protein [Phycisphaerales bacterium]
MIIRTLLLSIITTGVFACERPTDSADGTTTVTHRIGDRVVLAVSGMHCDDCETAIKHGALTCEGVNDVAASASDDEVVVWVDPGTDLDSVRAKISSLGFKIPSPQID